MFIVCDTPAKLLLETILREGGKDKILLAFFTVFLCLRKMLYKKRKL